MNTRILTYVLIGLALVSGLGYWYVSSQSAKWELRFKILEDENKTLKEDVRILAAMKVELVKQVANLTKQIEEVRKQKAQQIEIVWKMPPAQVTTNTAPCVNCWIVGP